jgi:hypothetical protein
MTGRITRLIDTQQRGLIAAEDGQQYEFQARSLSAGLRFDQLSLGTAVNFDPAAGPAGSLRAIAVRPDVPPLRRTPTK